MESTRVVIVGIMQGRLLPPERDRIQSFPKIGWRKEFELARVAGLDCIEWIYDTYSEDANPLATDEGLEELDQLAGSSGVQIRSVCADYFIERPLAKGEPAARESSRMKLEWLIGQCRTLDIQRIVLPFVDQSALISPAEIESCVSLIQSILPRAVKCGIELHLETDLNPDAFRSLLQAVPHPLVKANYDTGNSASLGYLPREEFAAYGGRIGSVHVKDRKKGGGTVPLGTGDTDFPTIFQLLRELNSMDDFILQAARGPSGDEVEWARKNIGFIKSLLKK